MTLENKIKNTLYSLVLGVGLAVNGCANVDFDDCETKDCCKIAYNDCTSYCYSTHTSDYQNKEMCLNICSIDYKDCIQRVQ